MSNFIFATLPFAGHTMPALPIAAELVRRGHSVRWYAGAAFADRIAAWEDEALSPKFKG